MATNTFGLDMEEGEDAYNPNARSDEYSEIEVIARVLFAESGVIMDDQMAVANVMYNISQYRNWTVYYTVANKTRFAGYQSYLYYNPIQTSRLWSLAVNGATRLSFSGGLISLMV